MTFMLCKRTNRRMASTHTHIKIAPPRMHVGQNTAHAQGCRTAISSQARVRMQDPRNVAQVAEPRHRRHAHHTRARHPVNDRWGHGMCQRSAVLARIYTSYLRYTMPAHCRGRKPLRMRGWPKRTRSQPSRRPLDSSSCPHTLAAQAGSRQMWPIIPYCVQTDPGRVRGGAGRTAAWARRGRWLTCTSYCTSTHAHTHIPS